MASALPFGLLTVKRGLKGFKGTRSSELSRGPLKTGSYRCRLSQSECSHVELLAAY